MAIGAAVLFVATLVLWYPAWFFVWVFVLPYAVPWASPALAWLNDRPSDTRFTHSWKDGTTWHYCRNLPSGRAIFEPNVTVLEHGRRCGVAIAAWYQPVPSLERPGLQVSLGGWISIAVPKWADFGAFRLCPYKLSPAYLADAKALLVEVRRLPDLPEQHRQSLKDASASLASFTPERLREGGMSAGTYYCDLNPPRLANRP